MSIISKMKRAIGSRADAALDKALDPAKEIDLLISELEDQRKEAVADLLSYKASANKMESDVASLKEKAETWEKRAMVAVKNGDDDTARECLRRKKECLVDLAQIRRDQLEAAGYAAELNQSRKQVEVRLRMLKLKKGTMANQIAAARGKKNVLSTDNELFAKLEQAEDEINEAEARVEADAELAGSDTDLEAALLREAQEPETVQGADDPLEALKAKMESEKRLLKD
jgi:phage shock protein A